VGARDGGGYVRRLHERIERSRPGSRLVNLCASGASTADVLNEQAPRLAGVKPTLVTLGVGANDLIRGVKADDFARDFEALVKRLREGADSPIVVLNIPDISLAPAVPAYLRPHARQHIVAFNQRLEEIAKRYDLTVIDLYGRSREFASHPEFFSSDGLHPSGAGYEFWADLLWPHAERLCCENWFETKKVRSRPRLMQQPRTVPR
jgi:lysophospholipase L1-like esterase